jgi:hypothetical protein
LAVLRLMTSSNLALSTTPAFDSIHPRVHRPSQDGDAGGCRNRLLEQLQPFCHEFAKHERQTCYVTRGPGQAGDESRLDGIANGDDNNWNRRGRLSGCVRCRADRDDNVAR